MTMAFIAWTGDETACWLSWWHGELEKKVIEITILVGKVIGFKAAHS